MQLNQKLCPGQFYGTVVKERQVADSILTEYSYAADMEITSHSHTLPYFSIILEGIYQETHGGQLRECKPAMLLFHPEGEVHADRFLNNPCRIFCFELKTEWLTRASQCSLALKEPLQFCSGAATWLASRLYRELYATDVASHLAVEGLLLEVIAEAARYAPARVLSTPPRWLEQARELIRSSFSGSLSINAIAKTVGVHSVHLSREFRRFYQQSIGDYARELRIEFACREIRETTTPLLEIAVAAGFADHGHFTRNFKRLTGMTPSQYRATFGSR